MAADREYFNRYNESNTKLTILTQSDNELNIAHFQGMSSIDFKEIQHYLMYHKIESGVPDNLTILTTETDETKSMLCQQLNLNYIPYVNSCDGKRFYEWDNTKKIELILESLKKIKTDYVLILDSRDVLINSFDGLIEKYKNSGLEILFNATINNYPHMVIDYVRDREKRGTWQFFNAGCCIGKRESLIKFYTECKELLSEHENDETLKRLRSEQYIVRHAFAKYSNKDKNTFIDFDYQLNIFLTFQCCKVEGINETTCKLMPKKESD